MQQQVRQLSIAGHLHIQRHKVHIQWFFHLKTGSNISVVDWLNYNLVTSV